MSDNKLGALTPIIVGVVIALIGILTGLYIADNAREQLAVATQTVPVDVTQQPVSLTTPSAAPNEASLPADEIESLDELPPLEPIVVDAMPPVDNEEDKAPAAKPEVSEVPETLAVVQPELPAGEPEIKALPEEEPTQAASTEEAE